MSETTYSPQPAVISRPSYEERVFFVGANGSGKTVLASAMLAGFERAIVLDIKYDFPIPSSWDEETYRIAHRPPGLRRQGVEVLKADPWSRKRVIYRPEPPFDEGPWLTYLLDWIFRRSRREGKKKPIIVYLDEGAWMAYGGAKVAMARLAITGRSLGIGLWISSQRPKGIPVEVRSEAWRMYIFYLRNRGDRKEILDNVGDVFTSGDHLLDVDDLSHTAEDYQFAEIRRGKGGRMHYRLLPPVAVA